MPNLTLHCALHRLTKSCTIGSVPPGKWVDHPLVGPSSSPATVCRLTSAAPVYSGCAQLTCSYLTLPYSNTRAVILAGQMHRREAARCLKQERVKGFYLREKVWENVMAQEDSFERPHSRNF